MAIKNTTESYGWLAKAFHWLMALMIVALIAVGYIMSDMENNPDKFKIYGLHKSLGISVLILAGLRLLWKGVNIAPLFPAGMKPVEKFAAYIGHAALYFFMFSMPLTGWMMSSAAGFSVSLFGFFTLPDFVAPDKAFAGEMRDLHEIFSYGLIVMIVLHAMAALLHHYHHKNDVLRRMLPCLAVSLAFVPLDSRAEVGIYEIVKEKSSLKFFAIQNNAPLEGKFSDFSADIRFDVDQLEKSSIRATVNTASVFLSYDEALKNIVLPEWLSVEKFPVATFVSKTISRTPNTDGFYADGDLTIRNKILPAQLIFTLTEYGPRVVAQGNLTVQRLDYGVGQGQWTKTDVIKNEVRIELRIVADKK